MQPCPWAYNTERSWNRRKYRFQDCIPESLCLFPSKDQFDILKANGYITSHASYDLRHTPDFDFCWLGPHYDLRELSIRSPLLQQQKQQQQQRQQQRKLAIPKSRQKHAPRYAGQETTNSQAMLRTDESMQASLQQAIDAVSARGQLPPPPPPQPQPQPQPHPGRASVVYNIERGINVTFGRNSPAGVVADTPRPTSISEWARDIPQYPDAQSETARDNRSPRDRMTFPLESRMTYDTQSNAGSSSTRPRSPAPAPHTHSLRARQTSRNDPNRTEETETLSFARYASLPGIGVVTLRALSKPVIDHVSNWLEILFEGERYRQEARRTLAVSNQTAVIISGVCISNHIMRKGRFESIEPTAVACETCCDAEARPCIRLHRSKEGETILVVYPRPPDRRPDIATWDDLEYWIHQ